MNFGILPLRAIAFQTLFLMIAISLEAVIFFRRMGLDYKDSVRYSMSLNLFSTVLGWVIFFGIEGLLPEVLRVQLISFFFFERFFPNPLSPGVTPLITLYALTTFLGVVFIERQALTLLDWVLGKWKPEEETMPKVQGRTRFRQMQERGLFLKNSDRTYTVLVANALSFSVILFLLLMRWVDQAFQVMIRAA